MRAVERPHRTKPAANEPSEGSAVHRTKPVHCASAADARTRWRGKRSATAPEGISKRKVVTVHRANRSDSSEVETPCEAISRA